MCTVFLPIAVVVGMRAMKKHRKGSEEEAKLKNKLKERQHAELQKAKPMLAMIDKRLGNDYTTKLDDNGDLVDYDAEILFDAIDADGNGVLCFDELSKAMNLSGDQLLVFIQMMNEVSGLHSKDISHSEVSRAVFSASFLDTIKAVSNFDPTQEDAEDLFDSIVQDSGNGGTLNLENLKNSPLSLFLNDKQILNLIRLFESNGFFPSPSDEETPAKPQDTKRSSSSRSSRRMSKGGPRSKRYLKRQATINKESFAQLYPELLSEVVNGVEEQLEPCDLHFENLSLHVNVNNTQLPVVNDVTGRVRSGTMTALMGKFFACSNSPYAYLYLQPLMMIYSLLNRGFWCWKNFSLECSMWQGLLWYREWKYCNQRKRSKNRRLH